ncbi:flagellar basal-body MS-ring/collar protein FliF [Hyphobacterium sp. HN65]|uniref:Flagellar M-ring protein n=1 Tax=Hyphobacterium lacteum TaxID=3116575 RepID=A0ABU7LQD7_9PROT|nr:flagellar basal-body MS-ring/collar protein FliF [Hyphobacterium sp. HN65]MEE2526112.1 flagellar basal-body MS-ring/collar protein FliF [Hyphobacterium sp. HN65]
MDQLRSLGAMRLIAIFGLSAGLAAALLFFSFNMGGGSQALLYSGLDPSDSARVSEALDTAGIAYEFRGGGSSIYVARNQVDEARVRVASGGALNSGSVGYEIFDETDALGSTSFVQNMNAKRALEGELARTIQSLDNIDSARVHLVMPERRLFERDAAEPSASIVISARGNLTAEHAGIIRNIVASAVSGLSANDITIADTTGRLLASPQEGDSLGAAALEGRRAQMEEVYRQRILDLVEGVVGPGAARVQVSLELNRNSITESQELYDPEGSVLRSRTRSSEESTETDGSSNAVSASENLPDDGTAGSEGPQSARQSESSNDQQEFALSRTTTTRVTEAGQVERMSVAVAVDGTVQTEEDGTTTYVPRSAEEMAQITALVRSAMGFTQVEGGRQDSLEVTNIRFARADPTLGTPAASGFSINKNDIMRAAEIGVMFITALLVIFLVARPLAKNAAAAGPALAIASSGGAGAGVAAAIESGGEQPAIADQSGRQMPQPSASAAPAERDDGIDIAKIDGQVKASSIKKVAGVVNSHPDESLSILRTWMSE